MSDKAAGWYPDPDGEARQRYWDGDSWTEYYTPLAPQRTETHGADTAREDYPYLSAATGSLMTASVQVGSGNSGWPTAPATGGNGETQEFSGRGRRSSASVWALVAASALVVMLIIGVGWWAFGPDTPAEDPTATDTEVPTDGETVTADLGLDAAASATVPAGGLWVGTLTVDSDRTVLIDVHGAGSSDDLRVTVVPEDSDDPVAGNDDRGSNLSALSDSALNPLAAATLPAGNYEVRVDERNGSEVDFDIVATTLTTSLTPDVPVDVSVSDGGYWAAELTVTDGTYTIDVEGITSTSNTNPDPVVVVIGNSDRQYYNDDRSSDDRNPLLTQDLAAGTWVVVVFDYRTRPLTAEVTLTAES